MACTKRMNAFGAAGAVSSSPLHAAKAHGNTAASRGRA
jgi:hypothetical protein